MKMNVDGRASTADTSLSLHSYSCFTVDGMASVLNSVRFYFICVVFESNRVCINCLRSIYFSFKWRRKDEINDFTP